MPFPSIHQVLCSLRRSRICSVTSLICTYGRFCQDSNPVLAQKPSFWYAPLIMLAERGTATNELPLLCGNDNLKTNEENQIGIYYLLLQKCHEMPCFSVSTCCTLVVGDVTDCLTVREGSNVVSFLRFSGFVA